MKKVLVAVDESKGSLSVIDTFMDIFSCMRPEEVILLYVEKLGGGPMMDEMLGGPEMATMKEALKGTDYQNILDNKAEKVLDYYRAAFDKNKVTGVRGQHHPARVKGEAEEQISHGQCQQGIGQYVGYFGTDSQIKEQVYTKEVSSLSRKLDRANQTFRGG